MCTGNPNDLTEAITLENQAVVLAPADHPSRCSWLSSLAGSLEDRFELRGSIDDLEQAIAWQTTAVEDTSESHPSKSKWLSNLGNKLLLRFERLGNREDVERAIVLFGDAVKLTPEDHTDMPSLLNNLANALQLRFEYRANALDLESAIAYQTRAVSLTPNSHSSKPSRLNNLGTKLQTRFQHSGSLEDLDAAIAVKLQAMEVMPEGYSGKLSSYHLYNLSNSLRTRFEKTGNVADLTEAIRRTRQLLKLSPVGHPDRASNLNLLGALYRLRLTSPHSESNDSEHAMEAWSEAMQHASSPPDDRIEAGRRYVSLHYATALASSSTIPTSALLQAHEQVVALIPQAAWLGNSIGRRYEELVEYGSLTSRAAADAIEAGEYTQALEWLESGRSIVWHQILQLRTPLGELAEHHPKLADELRHVSQALQSGVRPTATGDISSRGDSDSTTSLSPEIQAQSSHAYAAKYNKLLAQIRGLAGFEDFLRPRKLAQLSSACESGPVVMINVHKFRCDALVLSSPSKITHVPLPDLSHHHAEYLQTRIRGCLKAKGQLKRFRVSSDSPDRGEDRAGRVTARDVGEWMYDILADLWKLVVKPVLDVVLRLDLVSSSTRSAPSMLPRITWCPTGPLSFLPLHAAGIYPKGRNIAGSTQVIMKFTISSYTPTLEALLRPRTKVYTASGRYPNTLIVSQPAAPGFPRISGTVQEAATVGTLVGSSTVLNDADGTIQAVLGGMASHDWIHFACHGIQRSDNPTQSSFALYDGPLTLEKLIAQSLPNADLAVLSACQTATGDEKLAEEAIHLAAGMLTIGYKSVIGTMWSIDDFYAPTVMKRFYEVLMQQVKTNDELQPAYALHEAMKVLREKCGVEDFLRWIPFVHFGL